MITFRIVSFSHCSKLQISLFNCPSNPRWRQNICCFGWKQECMNEWMMNEQIRITSFKFKKQTVNKTFFKWTGYLFLTWLETHREAVPGLVRSAAQRHFQRLSNFHLPSDVLSFTWSRADALGIDIFTHKVLRPVLQSRLPAHPTHHHPNHTKVSRRLLYLDWVNTHIRESGKDNF